MVAETTARIRAGVFKRAGLIEVENVVQPALGEGQFRVRIGACGICGSDLHAYRKGWTPVGAVMGHEYAGVVVETDAIAQAAGVEVGQRLAFIPMATCGRCASCTAGRANLCEVPLPQIGGYAETLLLSLNTPRFEMPTDMTMAEASFLEPLSVAVRAVSLARHPVDAPAVVIGLGTIGQCVVQVLKAAGVKQVIGLDLSQLRRDTAAKLGADFVLDPADGDVMTAVRDLIGGGSHRGYEFASAQTVFECSGSVPALQSAVSGLVRAGGSLVLVALFEEDVTFDANALVRKEVRLLSSYAYTPRDYAQAFSMLAGKRVNVRELITHIEPLSAISTAFATQFDMQRSVKVIIAPNADVT